MRGQQPPQSPRQKAEESDIVRITTNLVQIDAAVTDKHGKQITDLKPEEFQVFQDGHLQQVSHASYVSLANAENRKPVASPTAKNSDPLLPPLQKLGPNRFTARQP